MILPAPHTYKGGIFLCFSINSTINEVIETFSSLGYMKSLTL